MSNKNSWLSFKLSKNNKKLIKNINMNIDDIDKINDYWAVKKTLVENNL